MEETEGELTRRLVPSAGVAARDVGSNEVRVEREDEGSTEEVMSLGPAEMSGEEGVVARADDVEMELMIVGYSDESFEEDEIEGWMEREVSEENKVVVVEGKNWVSEELSDFVEGRVEGSGASDASDKVGIRIGVSRVEGGSEDRGRRRSENRGRGLFEGRGSWLSRFRERGTRAK